MKRSLFLLLSVVLAFTLAGTASASAATGSTVNNKQAVKVVVNGKAVDFGSNLIMIKGKTFIEYAALFKQLGYETEFDSALQTFYAKADNIEIQASVGADIVLVNEHTVVSTGEIIAKNGLVMVGVRFAGLLTNNKVEWIGKENTISMTYAGPSEEDKAAIVELFSKMLVAEAGGNGEDLVKLMSDDTVMDIESVRDIWESTRTRTSIEGLDIQSFSDDAAVTVLIENTIKVSGDFFPDNKTQTRYTLHKDKAGAWKIYSIEVLGQEYTNIPGLFDQEVKIPESDKAAIGKVFEEQMKAANSKNTDAYIATLIDFEGKEELKLQLDTLFKETAIDISTEKWTIVEYNGSDKAQLLVSILNKVDTNGKKVQTRSVILNPVEKVAGKWLLSAEVAVISNEQL
ncbi:stalk domain-containing protein [Cohnella sp. WQ 127256]|uniref:stalk domain-containing protein n=1 Tax=Cohnella sp. WQ 127256 TaxID=2938790 RepID=UPI002117850D|nr:stalk domain-containing protein [Cohnella sp. WQ 127256]